MNGKIVNIGVIGYGYWGPNVVRTANETKNAAVKIVCDKDVKALQRAKTTYPHIEITRQFDDIIKSKNIDAVAIVTPVSTHYKFAKLALEHGKHIFIEKPFTAKVEEAETLVRIAKKNKRIIMVDHTFIFTGAVRKIKEIIDNKTLGDLYYYDSTRVNLGLFQQDVNVIWDLAPHDFSIIDYIFEEKPVSLSVQGIDHINSGQENIAYITLHFKSKMIAHININWLSPVKIRRTLIGGQQRILVWNDLDADEKIKIYDKSVSMRNKESINKARVDYRMGDMFAPKIEHAEALNTELAYFVDCVLNNKKPINDGESGLRVVKMLKATDESLRKEGKLIKLQF